MSHLLTRLVDRAIGVSPAIEPVRLPIFGAAPAAGFEQDSGREVVGFAYADIITGAQAMHPTGTQTSAELSHTVTKRAEQESSPSSPVQPVEKQVLHEFSNEYLAAQSPLQPQSNEPADYSALRASPARLIESVAVEPGPPVTEVSPVTPQTPRSSDSLSPRDAVEPEPPSTVVSPVTPQTPRSSDSLAPRDEQRPKAVNKFSRGEAFPDSYEQTRVESLLRPQAVTSRDVVDKLPQQVINSRVEQPTIKVTIGRIEVRAMTTPQAQAPRQRKKTQPSLSLDDYLKQRAGGH